MAVDPEEVIKRRIVFETADTMVQPLVNQHDLKDHNSGPVFTSNPVTKIDQHITHILRVADWLLET